MSPSHRNRKSSSTKMVVMGTYVLVHGAWHTGKELEPVAVSIKAAGHAPFTPTIKGNRPGDSRSIGLIEAFESVIDYLVEKNLRNIVLVGHILYSQVGGWLRTAIWVPYTIGESLHELGVPWPQTPQL